MIKNVSDYNRVTQTKVKAKEVFIVNSEEKSCIKNQLITIEDLYDLILYHDSTQINKIAVLVNCNDLKKTKEYLLLSFKQDSAPIIEYFESIRHFNIKNLKNGLDENNINIDGSDTLEQRVPYSFWANEFLPDLYQGKIIRDTHHSINCVDEKIWTVIEEGEGKVLIPGYREDAIGYCVTIKLWDAKQKNFRVDFSQL